MNSLELKKFSFLYGYNRILYVNDIPAITAILESFPVHDCTLSFSYIFISSAINSNLILKKYCFHYYPFYFGKFEINFIKFDAIIIKDLSVAVFQLAICENSQIDYAIMTLLFKRDMRVERGRSLTH
ncbi:hypothetical protein Anas_11656 [Armadillidium nasatum]|uniref:Uncharacterized protein n=1 Tax=Armadillidium nasatum TaxID=96803 RepID=A0A5N5TDJ0_9CRUS|nr:hypothetical protein Anas_11656 [Armadillidium nasatum]